MRIRISKSKFVAGCQCVKRLYWQVHEPQLAAQTSAADQAIIEQGREVGMLARQLFPGGVEVCSDGGLDKAIRATRQLVANPEVPAIFEGVFTSRQFNNLVILPWHDCRFARRLASFVSKVLLTDEMRRPVSWTGCGVRSQGIDVLKGTREALMLGENVILEIPFPDTDKQVIPAKVVRVLGTEYGFQFTALSAEQRGHIQATLKGRPAIPLTHSATQTSA